MVVLKLGCCSSAWKRAASGDSSGGSPAAWKSRVGLFHPKGARGEGAYSQEGFLEVRIVELNPEGLAGVSKRWQGRG